jgi:nicotinamide mononucleotide transporter
MSLAELTEALQAGVQAMSGLEIIAVLLSASAVWLTVKQNLLCWPLGLVSVLMYSWVFFDVKLYSDMLLQLVYAVLQLYGWWQWTRGGVQHAGRQVSRLPGSQLLLSLAVGSAGSLLLGYLMATHTDAAAPWLDAALTSFSLVAQVWMAQKRLECWPLWIALDVIYVGLFLSKDLYLTAALYAVFTALAIAGWRAWQRPRAAPAI